MLTLSRKVGESIFVGEGDDRIEILVREIKPNQVRLSISTTNGQKILRKELLEGKRCSNGNLRK